MFLFYTVRKNVYTWTQSSSAGGSGAFDWKDEITPAIRVGRGQSLDLKKKEK